MEAGGAAQQPSKDVQAALDGFRHLPAVVIVTEGAERWDGEELRNRVAESRTATLGRAAGTAARLGAGAPPAAAGDDPFG